jgi:TIR domain
MASSASAAGGARSSAGHAFISYVHQDTAHVDRLQQILEDADIPVWRDTADLWPGQDWRAQIRGAITRDALAFIACFSRASMARGQSYQYEELTLAIEQLRQRPHDVTWLIPVRFHDCLIPDTDIGGGRTLRYLQYADLFGAGHTESAGRLVRVISTILGHPAETDGRSTLATISPEVMIAEPEDPSDAGFTPPVRSVVFVETREPIDDLSACYVTDQALGGTTGLGHAPFHVSTSRWRIRSEFLLRSVADVIIGYTTTRARRKVQRFQWDGYDHEYEWNGPGADGSHLSALHQIMQARQAAGRGAEAKPTGNQSLDPHSSAASQASLATARIVLRGGPQDGEIAHHARHPADYVAFAGGRLERPAFSGRLNWA